MFWPVHDCEPTTWPAELRTSMVTVTSEAIAGPAFATSTVALVIIFGFVGSGETACRDMRKAAADDGAVGGADAGAGAGAGYPRSPLRLTEKEAVARPAPPW